jgi:hypothetical protein
VLCRSGFSRIQWDALLLETGFLAIFLGRSKTVVWLFRWLVFRVFFLSGAVKLLSHDPTWRDFTALRYHFHTQPLPTVFAWFADHLPDWFLRLSTQGMFFVELAVPFLIFMPRRLRMLGASLLIGFEVLIAITGNYGFFNLLTIVLCLFLFDDRFFSFKRFPAARSDCPNASRTGRRNPAGDFYPHAGTDTDVRNVPRRCSRAAANTGPLHVPASDRKSVRAFRRDDDVASRNYPGRIARRGDLAGLRLSF